MDAALLFCPEHLSLQMKKEHRKISRTGPNSLHIYVYMLRTKFSIYAYSKVHQFPWSKHEASNVQFSALPCSISLSWSFFEYSSISLVLVYIISVCCRETHDYYWRATCIHQTIIQMVRYIMHHDSCAISNTPQTEGEHCLCICWVECSLMTSFYRAPFTSVCGLCSSSGQNMCMQWRGCMQH